MFSTQEAKIRTALRDATAHILNTQNYRTKLHNSWDLPALEEFNVILTEVSDFNSLPDYKLICS